MADFGLPQARRRLVLIASKGFHVALPTRRKPIGWYEAIAHLIPTMPDSQLLLKQQQALEKFLAGNAPTPLLIERVGGRTQSKYKPGHLPCNIILRSHFTDHKGCNRSKFADIWLPDGTVKSLSACKLSFRHGNQNNLISSDEILNVRGERRGTITT
ncbi:hypothetical protein [uncultured Nostoc sp.]|uniref:hypothetical protein n=1 Tax=uncultured Nostoc sp. TaxID=340711 RepID=UPI0035CC5C72